MKYLYIFLIFLIQSLPSFARQIAPTQCANDGELIEIYRLDYDSRMTALDRFWRAYGGCGSIDQFWNFAKLPVRDLQRALPEEACGYSGSFDATKDF